MTGDIDTARTLLHAVRSKMHELYDLGLEWSGTARFVFLREDVVYKIEHDRFGCLGGNSREYDNYLKWKDRLPPGFAFPEMTLYDLDDDDGGGDVIAAEFIPGRYAGEACDYPYLEELISVTHFEDHSYENVLVYNDIYYIVDFD